MAELTLVEADHPSQARTLPFVEFVRGWRTELDEYYERMHRFSSMEMDEIFMELAAFSARASEIRTNIVRVESRLGTAFRTQEIDPFLNEIDRQFKLYSRIQAVRAFDWEMSRG